MGRKPVSRPSDPVDGKPMLKMKELVEMTGISKATILYYLSEKLLPLPVKTSPNVAYYPSSTVERIQLIRQLQSRHRFSLAQIRIILQEREKGRDVEALIEFNKEIFSQKEGASLDRKSFCVASGLTRTQLRTALALRLLIPESENSFDAADLKAGNRLKNFLALGISLDNLAFYARLADEIVSQEMAVRKRLIRTLSYDEALAATLQLTQGARFFREYIIERIFQRQALGQPLELQHK
ncbi:MerR family transcriptional regulator [bacterium]|nr:MerR family transcriptional regulator [bacterium]